MSQKDYDETYTRVRFNAQVGDGPDQRGDVTVEVQATIDEGSASTVSAEAREQLDDNVEHLRAVLGLDE